MRFAVMGNFAGTDVAKKAKQHQPPLGPREMVIKWVKAMGGFYYTKESAERLMYQHSQIPNFFIVLKDATEQLCKGTMTSEDFRGYEMTSKKKKYASTTKPEALSSLAIDLRKFAGGDFKFLEVNYILDSLYSDAVLDPLEYQIKPGSKREKIIVNNIRPLLMDQINGKTSKDNVSAIVALKRKRLQEKNEGRPTPALKRKRVGENNEDSPIVE